MRALAVLWLLVAACGNAPTERTSTVASSGAEHGASAAADAATDAEPDSADTGSCVRVHEFDDRCDGNPAVACTIGTLDRILGCVCTDAGCPTFDTTPSR